ncbi:MAG: CarD family transcriptional regulator [Clostridia bacterium]|nr:CarD family transcriptional regulator [Clostridia bacterium]
MQRFEKSQYIRYGANGVCQIDDIGPLPGTDTPAQYYILKPITDKRSVYYIPVDSETLTSKMRPLLTRKEINSIIDSVKDVPREWIEDRNERNESFRAALRESNTRKTLLIIGALYQHKEQLLAAGKKPSSSDDYLLKEAEGLIENEFAFVLGLETGEIGSYIRTRLGLE